MSLSTNHPAIVALVGEPIRERTRYEHRLPTTRSFSVGRTAPDEVNDGYVWACGCWTEPDVGFGRYLWTRCGAHRNLRPASG